MTRYNNMNKKQKTNKKQLQHEIICHLFTGLNINLLPHCGAISFSIISHYRLIPDGYKMKLGRFGGTNLHSEENGITRLRGITRVKTKIKKMGAYRLLRLAWRKGEAKI